MTTPLDWTTIGPFKQRLQLEAPMEEAVRGCGSANFKLFPRDEVSPALDGPRRQLHVGGDSPRGLYSLEEGGVGCEKVDTWRCRAVVCCEAALVVPVQVEARTGVRILGKHLSLRSLQVSRRSNPEVVSDEFSSGLLGSSSTRAMACFIFSCLRYLSRHTLDCSLLLPHCSVLGDDRL